MHVLETFNRFYLFNALSLTDRLEGNKVYQLNFKLDSGECWLEKGKDFNFPKKIYDDNSEFRDNVKKVFKHENKNLGVFLTGNKGQGKSLTLALLCKEIGEELNLPIIQINRSIPKNVNFVDFLNSIEQDYILVIDEFEKLFEIRNNNDSNYHSQEVFLTFLSGATSSKHKILTLIATNGVINDLFINRAARIRFQFPYEELSETMFDMIVEDRLVNKDYKEDLSNNVFLGNLNIDTLIAIIDTINLLDKPFSKFKNQFNYKGTSYVYDVYMSKNGGKFEFLKTWKSDQKPKIDQYSIAHVQVKQFIKFTSEEIIFEGLPYEEEDEKTDKLVKINPVYKCVKLEILKGNLPF